MNAAKSHPHPPRGWSRLFWRLPIWFYRANLGWLLGERFLLLNHIGRKSGQVRQAVLEVVQIDRTGGVYFVAAGFGSTSDWYQNLLKRPQAEIRTGWRSLKVRAETLVLPAAEAVIREYARHHPVAMRGLAQVFGYQVRGGEVDYHEFVQTIPIVSLQVIDEIK